MQEGGPVGGYLPTAPVAAGEFRRRAVKRSEPPQDPYGRRLRGQERVDKNQAERRANSSFIRVRYHLGKFRLEPAQLGEG
jgi:hypothetical protein